MVASLQAGKAIFAMRGDEVVADRCLVLQKFVGHLHADGVFPNVVRTCIAFSIAIKAGQWICATGLQSSTQNIFGHYQ